MWGEARLAAVRTGEAQPIRYIEPSVVCPNHGSLGGITDVRAASSLDAGRIKPILRLPASARCRVPLVEELLRALQVRGAEPLGETVYTRLQQRRASLVRPCDRSSNASDSAVRNSQDSAPWALARSIERMKQSLASSGSGLSWSSRSSPRCEAIPRPSRVPARVPPAQAPRR